MNIQQSTELIIFVTHVEAEDSFLKIWGQIDKNSATCVERMILPLVEHFTRSQGCIGPSAANLHVNALCCAKFQNEGYYRARVINICPDGMVVLQFIDYGNIEILPSSEIHLLDTIPGSESLRSFPPVAFDFKLMNVLPVNGIWENKIIESIKKTLWYDEYKILIHTVVNNHRFIKLWYNNEDFSELLIKKHMAIRASLHDIFRLKCVQQPQVPIYQPSKHSISDCTTMTSVESMNPLQCDGNKIHGYQSNVPLCCIAQQKQMMQTPVQEALVFKSRVLDVPSKHDVYVSFVEDGPHKFSVQLRSTSQILSALMRDINVHPIKPLQEPPLPGSVCLGRYTQDKVLCRAVVMSVMENKCKLYYVDFGHTELLPYTDIFQLPPHFINPRVLSIRFTLSGVYELNTTEEMKAYFKRIVSGKLLVLHVRPPEGPPLVQYGDLYDDGKNIKDILRQAFPTPAIVTPAASPLAYQEPKRLIKGAEEIVHVSFVESCNKFFVQLESYSKSLELIMSHLTEFCKTAPALSLAQLKIGLPCAALYDNQWYRAQILSLNANNIKVLYVDYGNEETVPLISLRSIREDMVKKLQAQAIKCSLNDWDRLPCTQEVYDQFELLILEKRLCLKVIDVTTDGIIVDLYEPEKMENIQSQMLHIIGDENKVISELNYETMEDQHTIKMNPKTNQSESTNKWNKKNLSDSWRSDKSGDQMSNSNVAQEKSKFKTWKNESNEGKLNDNRSDKSNFYRNDTRNERLNRDDFSNNRSARDKWNNKNEYNESFKSGRGARGGGRNKASGHGFKNYSSDKSWSDKDSDTSSRGSGRRGRNSSTRGGYSKREGIFGRTQNNKFSDKENDGNFRSGRTGSDFQRGNNKMKDKKGQGYRLAQNKISAINSFSDGEGRRYSPMRNRNEFHIPSPNVSVGSTKTCEVIFITSLSDFFIQLGPDYTALDSVMENIASVYEGGGELLKESEILGGVYCIAQYSIDLKWYRALIKSVEGNNAVVQFVDYGNTETVEFDKIKAIQEEFLKLPIQAVHCKLFGVKNDALDKSKIKNFEDKVNAKTLETEFIIEENGVYSVLLREIDGYSANTYINEVFCENIDLLKAKEDVISKGKVAANAKRLNIPEYVSSDAKWTTISNILGMRKDVIITWFTNPNNFYCQLLDNESEFRTMMNEIQKIYVGREPVSHELQIGSPVIAIFSEDGALYRAEIMELNKFNGHLVQYIDFGNSAVVDPRKIYPVEKKLMHLTKQAVQCCLLNIVPQDGLNWSKVNTEAIDNCFNADKYECVFHDTKDDKYLISLSNSGNDVANTLVEKNLASFASERKSGAIVEDSGTTTSAIPCDVERVDINLLSGQTLRVKVSSVENSSKFYIQLPSASECENRINTYMANKDPEVMQRLAAHEICLGTGCLVYTNGVWRRAVISNHSRSAGFDVKFIDTGAYDEILSDSVLALPGELSVMQNQAIECSLADIVSSPEINDTLKKHIEGKEVIIHVNEVDNNRLIVKVFDLFGNKINVFEDSNEKISPVCPMPILSSTHKVSVSYADHSASIWLQRNAEYILDKNLSEALDQYYATSGSLTEPKVNMLCAAKSMDGHWYRAKVIKCMENGVYVNFIDYGNNEEVTPDVLMTLDSRFYTPYQLAINVSLPVMLNGPISEQLSILQNYLLNKELTAVFRNTNTKWVAELLYDGEKISDKFRSLNSTSEEMTGTLKPYIQNMKIGCMYNVFVSHTDSPSQFWLQHVDDATELSNKQEELQAQANTFPLVDGILEEGSLCVAVYTIDNLWYRAQVLDADEDITTVRFIDYGNTDIIDNKSGNIRQIPDSWKEIKEYAIKCRLDVIPVDSEDWNVTTCEKFENLVTSVDSLQTLIIANSIPKRVDLLINNKSISELLVEEHHAVRIHTEEELIDEIVDLELDPHSAFVSHINSPNEFWVQEEKSVGDLEVMTDRFIVAHMYPKVDKIEENLLCVAKYPEDECWYRARVISHNDDATRVIYIDYGNSANSTEIRAIPEDLADIPPLSRKCSLVMPDGITEWSQKACKEFIKLAADGATIFLLDVLKEDETSLVKLTLDGQNVTDFLASFCKLYPPIIEERLPPLGEENSPNVFITRVNTPDDFWIQTESSTTDINMMLDRLQAAPSFLPLDTFEIGTICAAKYSEDELWYRAKILSNSDNGTEVIYVDYGNTDITNEIRMLPVDIINIPPLAKHCTLQKPDSISDWSPEVCKKFEELAANGETIFQFEVLDDTNDPIHAKLSHNGINVVDILVSYSEHVSCDTATTKENLFKEETIIEEKGNEISLKCEEDTKNNMQLATLETYESLENVEEKKQEMEQNADNEHPNINPTLELTIDEIVQSMKPDEIEADETLKSNNSTSESYEDNAPEKIITDLDYAEEQTEKLKFDTTNNKDEYETQNMNKTKISPNIIKTTVSETLSTSLDTKIVLENLEDGQNNRLDSKTESTVDEKEICELKTDIQSNNLKEESTGDVESANKQSVTDANKEKAYELKTDIQSTDLNEGNSVKLESVSEQPVINDDDEQICEMNTIIQAYNLNKENTAEIKSANKQSVTNDNEENLVKLESTSEQSVTNDGKEEKCEINTVIQSSSLNEENAAELNSASKQSKKIDNNGKTCELSTDIQCNNLNEEKAAKLEPTSKQSVTNNNEEISVKSQSVREQPVINDDDEQKCEMNTVIEAGDLNEENAAKLESPNKQSVTNDDEENSVKLELASEHTVTNGDEEKECKIKSKKLNEESTAELGLASKQSLTSDIYTKATITKEKESDSENCKIQDENKVNISSELKTDKTDKNECLNVQSVEIANNECREATNKQDTILLSDSSVSMNVEKNDTKNLVHSENTSDTCK